MEYRKIYEIAEELYQESLKEYFECLGKFRDAKKEGNETLANTFLKEFNRISGESDGILKLFIRLREVTKQSGEETNDVWSE